MAEINEENIVKHKNLYYNKNTKKYTVSMNVRFKSLNKYKLVYLGTFENPVDAIKLIDLTKEKIKEGSFEEWYTQYHKSTIKKIYNPAEIKNVYYDKNSKKYSVLFNIKSKNTNKRKTVYLGAYENKDDAIKLVDLANKKMIEGSFEDWADNYRKELPRKKMANKKEKSSKKKAPNKKEKSSKKKVPIKNNEVKISIPTDDKYLLFSKDSKKWRVAISYKKKQYLFGRFSDKEEAIQTRNLAIKKINDDTFLEWYEEFKNNLSKRKLDINDEKKFIYYRKDYKKWQVIISYNGKPHFIGYFKDKEEAIQIRNLALKKIKDGSFDNWFNSYKSQIQKGGVYEINKSNNKKWSARILFNRKMYYLGSFVRKDEAQDVYNYAKNLSDVEFISWYDKHRLTIEKRKKSEYPGIYKFNNKYRVQTSYNGKTISLGSYEHLSDAINVRKEADKHKEAEDFMEWLVILKRKNKEENKKRGNGVYKTDDPLQKWSAHIQFHGRNYYLGSFKYKKDATEIYNYAKKLDYNIFLKWYNNYFDNYS